jgi:D-cysteine desulfhydrase family pyridoxal phosphate-dependent enzyme
VEEKLQLDDAPRVRLAHLPTALEDAPRLAAAAGASGRILVKRDDCTGLALGGNKTRKLEFTLGDALARGADVLVTTGGLQSNHVRQTAAAAARCGLGCHAVVSSPLPDPGAAYRGSGNLLLDGLFGAVIHEVEEAETDAFASDLVERLKGEGRNPYLVPLGASDGIGSLGYVNCARELLAQARAMGAEIGAVVLCTGSSGTHGGLLSGLRLAGSSIPVVGVSSSEPSAVKMDKVANVCRQVLERLGEAPWPGFGADIEVSDAYVGQGYGYPTDAADAAIRLAARTEGLVLDPVYTGKAMSGLIDMVAEGRFADGRDLVFLHTGGSPALFAYPDRFRPGRGQPQSGGS